MTIATDRLVEVETELRALHEAAGDAALTDEQQTTWDAREVERTTLLATIARDEARRATVATLAARADHTEHGDGRQARPQGGATVTAEPEIYGKGSGNSYFLDLARAKVHNDANAQTRLQRHAQELAVILPKREAEREQRAATEMRGSFGDEGGFEKRVNPNRTDGQGGYFVPPVWLIDQFVPLARAGRTFANNMRQMTLPSGTDSINVPKVSTGTTAAIQTADAAAVSSTDLTDTFLTSPVRTIAGQQDIALQLLDQSPVNFDEIVLADLLADYNMKLDVQTYYGSGASGQVKGATIVGSINSITYTDASPTGPELYLPMAQSVSKIASLRFLPPNAIFMHPRRWFWLASQLDSQNRPLVVPAQAQEFNPLAIQQGLVAEGPIGYALGLPIFIDANITTVGLAGAQTGGTEDQVITARMSDLFLWEGNLRTRTLTEVLSGTLQVRVQLWNYVAAMCDRYPASISVVSGTGMQAPSGF